MSLTSVAIVIVTLGGLVLNLRNRIEATESRLVARSHDLTAAAAPLLLNALVVDDLATAEQILRNLNLDRAWDKVALYEGDGRTLMLDVSPARSVESDAPGWLRRLLPLGLKEHRIEIAAAPVVYGVLAVVPSPRSLEGELWREARTTVITTGLLLATQLVLINMILSRGLRPIRSLAASATRFGAGDLSVRMPETTLAEVAPTVRAFNAMASNLERDITERKRAEGEKTELEGQLRQAQKMEAVGRLAGGIAHDFNNLLAVVMGRSDLVLQRLGPESPLHRHVKLIRETAVRAAGLTQQLLAFSRKQVLQPRVLDLNAALTGLQPMLRRLIGEDIEVDITLGSALWCIRVDPGQLDQVILNLAVNARDAMPQGGRLAFRTANVELDESFVRRHPGARTGPHVRLVVRDTGVGMDAETQAHLFEPFFTTKGPGKGTGLGLATVYGIIKQSGGHIAVDSAPGRGATFIIHLPRVEEVAAIPEAELPPEDLPRGSETILLVEDEDGVRALAHEILEASGYRVLPARHGAEALDVSDGHGPSIDLLLTDVVMPGISGRELVERLSVRRPDMRVLYMSGYTADALGPHGVLEADTALLAKPFTPDILTRKVREVLDAAGAPPARTSVRAPEHARSV